jgi:hypothetical protein
VRVSIILIRIDPLTLVSWGQLARYFLSSINKCLYGLLIRHIVVQFLFTLADLLKLLLSKIIQRNLRESERILENIWCMNFIVWLLEPSIRKIIIAWNFFLDLDGLVQVINIKIDAELIHFLIQLGSLLLVRTLNFASSNSLSLCLLLDSLCTLLLRHCLRFNFFSLIYFFLLFFFWISSLARI